MSDFYNDQIEAMVRLGNDLVFHVNFTVSCIKLYLDALHGIKNDSINVVSALELIKFIQDLGKRKLKAKFKVFNRNF